MNPSRARWLTSAAGVAALASLDAGIATGSPTALSAELRRRFPADETAALGEQLTLRAKARERFGAAADGLLFTTEGLEMATHPLVAARRAQRLAALGTPVADLTCGIGGDLLMLGVAGVRALGIEGDEGTALLAAHNVLPYTTAAVAQGDAVHAPLRLERMSVLIDPARRSDSGRRFDPKAFTPDWDTCMELINAGKTGVMKAPPGIEHRHLPPGAEVEFVQLGRSMREAAVWVGEGTTAGLRRAVLLPGGHELDSQAPEIDQQTVSPGSYIFDPESCVTRAGVVRQLGHLLGGRLMDPLIAYLTAEVPAFHPMAATFEVLDIVPFSVARLRERLRAGHWRADEIRRRGFPVEPDELRRLLGKLEGDPVTLLLTTLASKRLVMVAKRVPFRAT